MICQSRSDSENLLKSPFTANILPSSAHSVLAFIFNLTIAFVHYSMATTISTAQQRHQTPLPRYTRIWIGGGRRILLNVLKEGNAGYSRIVSLFDCVHSICSMPGNETLGLSGGRTCAACPSGSRCCNPLWGTSSIY
jgi:hypothetical protein